MSQETKTTRRGLFKWSFLGLLTLPFVSKVFSAAEANCPAAAPASIPAAQVAADNVMFSYVSDSTKAKTKKAPDANCANCLQYKKESIKDGYAECKLIKKGGKSLYVSNCGYCTMWVKKAGA